MAKRSGISSERLASILLFLAVTAFIISFNLSGNPFVEHLKYYLSLPFSPVRRAVQESGRSWREFLERHRSVEGVYRRNAALAEELARIKGKQADYRQVLKENAELRRLLGYRERSGEKLSLAYVLGRDMNIWRQGLLIDVGAVDGVRKDIVCLGEGCLVGKTVQVNRHQSLVMLITDIASSVSALDTRSAAQGVVCGAGPGRLDFRYLAADADVKVGDSITSSGSGGVYPRGYPLGTVTGVTLSVDRLNLRVKLRPAAGLEGLGHIFLLAELKERGKR